MSLTDARMEQMPPEWRYRWCGGRDGLGGGCACLGAANCSGGLRAEGVTYDEWEAWTQRHPQAPDAPELAFKGIRVKFDPARLR